MRQTTPSEDLACESSSMTTRAWTLVVEDNPVDAEALARAWREAGLRDRLVVQDDGETALKELAVIQPEELPDYVLLDLNMPRMSGLELMIAIKAHEMLRLLPLVVLTTSEQIDDRRQSFLNGASGYFLKPMAYEALVDTVKAIHGYWARSKRPW